MALYNSGSSSKSPTRPGRTTEFDILKASHKFLREDENDSQLTWNDQLAKKYYSSLYREYAVCDLKHYKSGQFALRWRTESEVISGAGESTCGNTRCPLHTEQGADGIRPSLKVLELPFQYAENGENKSALVKVTLCEKCCRKLMWKRTKEKELQRAAEAVVAAQSSGDGSVHPSGAGLKRPVETDEDTGQESSSKRERKDDPQSVHSQSDRKQRRRRHELSQSPTSRRR